jgi:Holliday junction DNA helicase RuvA
VIVAVEGEIVKKEPTLVDIKSPAGVTYRVRVSLNTSSKIDSKEIFLHTTLIVREDSHTLFGFFDELEKELFDRLIKINGVGPSIALAICSTFTPESFSKAVIKEDVASIKMVPGIGPKSAKRILVELGDFRLGEGAEKEISAGAGINEAMMALESLGFKKDVIKKALKGVDADDTQTLIKEALKKLGR